MTDVESDAAAKWHVRPSVAEVIAVVIALAALGLSLGAFFHVPRTGPAGKQGATGPIGQRGASGPTGPKGLQGIPGPAGPQGPAGSEGPAGVKGPAGPKGSTGATGPRGSAGSVAASAITEGTTAATGVNPPIGTLMVATAACPAGKVLLSGGAHLSLGETTSSSALTLEASYPLTDATWRAVAAVTATLPAGQIATLAPFALCT
jgi:hypothetical protein